VTDGDHYCYLLCRNLVDSIDFKTEKQMRKECRCDTYNVIERENRAYLKCVSCGYETEI
jgi:hypothetical protein